MIWKADDGTAVEHLGGIWGSSGEHIGENGRFLDEEAAVEAKGDRAGKEDEVTVFEPEVGMTSELLTAVLCGSRRFGVLGSNDNNVRSAARGAPTTFGRARIVSHLVKGSGKAATSWSTPDGA